MEPFHLLTGKKNIRMATCFEEIDVSTKTIIAVSNAHFYISELYEGLKKYYLTPYMVDTSFRGKKRKEEEDRANTHMQPGSIIFLGHGKESCGVEVKKRKIKRIKGKNYFETALTVVMIVDNPKKRINYKMTRNGKFQMTGCKTEDQAISCVKFMFEYMNTLKERDSEHRYYDISPNFVYKEYETVFKAVFITTMTNVVFRFGEKINQEKLDRYINLITDYHSFFETSMGYAGVNIKFPSSFLEEIQTRIIIRKEKDDWEQIKFPLKDYISSLQHRDQEKFSKLHNKERYCTFMVFNSGSVIASGITETNIKEDFYRFLDIIEQSRTFEV